MKTYMKLNWIYVNMWFFKSRKKYNNYEKKKLYDVIVQYKMKMYSKIVSLNLVHVTSLRNKNITSSQP